jgi:tRNA (guanine-N7-)-methyltransferase
VHVFFPDPWPKKRHHKRRLVQPRFVAAVARALAPGGALNVVTDFPPYAEAIREVVAGVAELAAAPTFHHAADLEARTHFAAKLARRGSTFHGFTWVRR